MERTITIKGVGRATIKPDFVILTLIVEAKEKKYACAVESAAKKIEKLNKSLEETGFEKESAKTLSYNVRANYSFAKDRKGQMQRQFDGYICTHRLKIEFDFDAEFLGNALSTISTSLANPQLDVAFTVKDKDAVNEELLSSAAINAKKKAEVLCNSSGASLGKLVTIDYNWSDINIFSKVDLKMDDTCELAMPTAILPPVDIHPNDINVSDSATFVWEIQ